MFVIYLFTYREYVTNQSLNETQIVSLQQYLYSN